VKQIHFIVNPVAGSGNNQLDLEFLSAHFDAASYSISLKTSIYKKHAIALTMTSVEEKADIIVACGGDGTINEVASCLVNTSIVLGIIPIGSGNGLASNLKIPKDVHLAIKKIKDQQLLKIDVGVFNEQYFFSNSGIGFDASVIKNFEQSEKRQLSSYIKASFTSLRDLKYNNDYEVVINEKTLQVNPFMIFISNSNEMGYNFSLTPKASLTDGLLDVLVISKISKLKLILFGILCLFKKHHWLKEVQCFNSKHICITTNKTNFFDAQIDGELHQLETNTLNIRVLEKQLNVII
jgi:YegS/Rv2252/BmrU family lipid kinase